MRKTLMHYNSGLVTALFVLACMTVQSKSGLRPRGDVNCDWEVTVADVNILIDAIMTGTRYHSLYTYALDLNGDKEINIADINMAVDALLGEELPPMPSYSGTLPVLFINTEGHRDIDSKEDYLNASWWLDNMGIEGYGSIGSASEPQRMEIKGRGHYSWNHYDKKPLRLKLLAKQEMLGMPANRHWALLANAGSWKGQIENTLSYEIGRRMGMAWNPHMEPVEVVLNGQYIGMYFLVEKITVDDDRVNIIEQHDNEVNPRKVTGGWLLEINNYDEPSNITFTEGNGNIFWVMPHSPKNLSDVQREYITDFLKNADAAIYSNDKYSTLWEQYIDIESLATYYVVQEIADNPEAFSGSCYMYKQRGDSTKLLFGPIWDCDHSYYRQSSEYQDEFIYEDVPSNWYCRWIAEIAKFPRFQSCVREKWLLFYEQIYPQIDNYLDNFAAKIEQAGNADYVRWPQYNNNNITYRLNHYGRQYFHKKVVWLQSQWSTRLSYNDASESKQKKDKRL